MTVREWFRILRRTEYEHPNPGEVLLFLLVPRYSVSRAADRPLHVTTLMQRRLFIDGTPEVYYSNRPAVDITK